jgi:DNA-binding response OmpR family regulator
MINSLRVLVADDDPVFRELLQLKLAGDGHKVTQAHDGVEALRLVSAGPPDLLVLDVAMPHVSGLEVTRQLRAQPETAHLPIVLLTGRDTDHDIVAGWKSGASYYITKPFVIEHLRYFIRTMQGEAETKAGRQVSID